MSQSGRLHTYTIYTLIISSQWSSPVNFYNTAINSSLSRHTRPTMWIIYCQYLVIVQSVDIHSPFWERDCIIDIDYSFHHLYLWFSFYECYKFYKILLNHVTFCLCYLIWNYLTCEHVFIFSRCYVVLCCALYIVFCTFI